MIAQINKYWGVWMHASTIACHSLTGLIYVNWKIVGIKFFGKLKISGNLVVKSKVPPCGGSVALRQLNPIHKKRPQSFFKKINWTCEIKPTLKNESEEWIWTRIYSNIIYRSRSFYRKHLKITCKLCVPDR